MTSGGHATATAKRTITTLQKGGKISNNGDGYVIEALSGDDE